MGTLGELVGKRIHRIPEPCNDFIIPDAKVGVEVEAEHARDITGIDESLWYIKTDGSLRDNGREFTTTDGFIGKTLKHAIYHICDIAKKNKYSVGEPRAGIHLHVDVTDLDVGNGELLRMVTNYMIVEHMLFNFCGEWRRHCGYCVPYDLGKADYETLGRLLTNTVVDDVSKEYGRNLIAGLSKYQALNLRPLIDLGTVEFRQLPTTFDPERIMFWINVALAIKKSASNPKMDNPLKRLSSLGPHLFCEEILTPSIYDVLRHGLREPEVWRAVDNASTLIGLGKQLTIAPKFVERGHNELLKSKVDKYKKSLGKKSAQTEQQDVRIPAFPWIVGTRLRTLNRSQDWLATMFADIQQLRAHGAARLANIRQVVEWCEAVLLTMQEENPNIVLPTREQIIETFLYPIMEDIYNQRQQQPVQEPPQAVRRINPRAMQNLIDDINMHVGAAVNVTRPQRNTGEGEG